MCYAWRSFNPITTISCSVYVYSVVNELYFFAVRVCVVDGRGSFRKSHKYCPILEATSNIECVIGIDRLDCVRRINKGSAHFGVFSAEDLVAARWADVEVSQD